MRGALEDHAADRHDLGRKLGVANLFGADPGVRMHRLHKACGESARWKCDEDALVRPQAYGRGNSRTEVGVARNKQGGVVPIAHGIFYQRSRDVDVCFLLLVAGPSGAAVYAATVLRLKSSLYTSGLPTVAPSRAGLDPRNRVNPGSRAPANRARTRDLPVAAPMAAACRAPFQGK